MRQLGIVLCAALVLLSACSTKGATGGTQVKFHGTLTTAAVDGRTWIIKADDGTRFEPMNLDEDFRVEALRVKVSGTAVRGTPTISQAKLLHIKEIRRI